MPSSSPNQGGELGALGVDGVSWTRLENTSDAAKVWDSFHAGLSQVPETFAGFLRGLRQGLETHGR